MGQTTGLRRNPISWSLKRFPENVRSLASSCLFLGCVVIGTTLATAPVFGQTVSSQTVLGADVYQTRCAQCHENAAASRAPSRDTLQKMTASRILRTLDFGLMMGVAYPLTREERQAVAGFLGTKGSEPGPAASAFCSAERHPLSAETAGNWNGWSPLPANTRFQPSGGITRDQVPRLKLKWAYGFAGDVTAFAAPTVLDDTIFVGSAGGVVQALEAKTGCLHWTFQANGPVRSAITAVANASGSDYSLLFGDQIGWFYSLEAKSGQLLWKHRIDDHEGTRLTGSPEVYAGVAFIGAASWEETRSIEPHYACCTFRGSVTALRVADGSKVWKTYTIDPPRKTGVNSAGAQQWGPSGAPVWSAPTIDPKRGVIYVTTGDNYSSPATATSDAVMALDITTGKIRWFQQTTPNDAYTSACRNHGPNCPEEDGPDYDFGSSALLLSLPDGKDILVAGQKSGVVYGLDPNQKGKVRWQTRVGQGGRNGGVQWGMASDGQAVFAAASDLTGVLNSGGAVGGAKFDPAKGGGLTALRPADGGKMWFVAPHPCDPPRPGCSPAQSQAVTAIPGVVFSGSVDGHLRAFAAGDGKILWDFDTAKSYSTVNGVEAKGGSLDGAGPVVAGGMLFVNSGYPRNGGMPGNVLLAFAPEE
ncbi:MAG: cytochrome C oxidase Cbb3 [Acidobacteria bacterium]|nr:MAG: cytochrome C oxidase Cbb3 [Acidobacteriota bacterium]